MLKFDMKMLAGLHILAARQSSAVFGEHICVEVDSLFIVHLPSVVFMFENTAHPRGLQCTALNYILASSDCSECKQFSEYKQRSEQEHSVVQMNAAKCSVLLASSAVNISPVHSEVATIRQSGSWRRLR